MKTLVLVFFSPSSNCVFRASSLLDQGRGVLLVVRRVVRVGLLEGLADTLGDLGVLHRVEPDVRVEAGRLLVLVVVVLGRVAADLVAVLLQRGEGGRVDLGLDLGLGDRVVDGGLEALEVEDRRPTPGAARSAWR